MDGGPFVAAEFNHPIPANVKYGPAVNIFEAGKTVEVVNATVPSRCPLDILLTVASIGHGPQYTADEARDTVAATARLAIHAFDYNII